MNIELVPATRADAHIIARLWPLYQYDMSEVGGTPINAFGLFEEASMSVHDYREDLELWWRNPERVHPYLIRVDGLAGGLVLVGVAPPFAPADCDYSVVEFFVLRGFRGRGIAQSVAREMFQHYPGCWELHVFAGNTVALAFWRRLLRAVAGDSVTEELTYIDKEGDMVIFRFRPSGTGVSAQQARPRHRQP
ncbi:MAG: GNAT family N-acetyltransferase [Capsulimonadaceae bacterium]